jgi:protein-tyrosine phosphatase
MNLIGIFYSIAGRSRSATIVIAWCMSRLQLDFFDAVAKVRKARSVVSPNPGFTAQLKLFGAMYCSLEGSSEVQRILKTFM